MTNDFDANMVGLLDVTSTFPAIRTIGVELFKPRALGTRLRNHGCGCVTVLHTRRSYCDCDEQAHRINDEITFSSLDLLACIESAFPALG